MSSIKMKTRGFTIVELLVVIVVIAILAAITIVSYNGVQARARAAAIVSGLGNVQKAFTLAGIEEGWPGYPKDTSFGVGNNPDISAIIGADSVFAQYLQQQPSVSGLTSLWQYDYDSDLYPDPSICLDSASVAGSWWQGANIYVSGLTPSLIQAVDAQMDDGNPLCGRVRYANSAMTALLYHVSWDGSW